jgi:hypothetical protein
VSRNGDLEKPLTPCKEAHLVSVKPIASKEEHPSKNEILQNQKEKFSQCLFFWECTRNHGRRIREAKKFTRRKKINRMIERKVNSKQKNSDETKNQITETKAVCKQERVALKFRSW